MDTPRTARLARRRSAAHIDRLDRKRHTSGGSRAAYSARACRRADRQITRAALRALTR